MEPAGLNDWAQAEVNRPFSTGDYLYTGLDGEAELHVDNAAIRMGAGTNFGFLNLNDQAIQIKLIAGDMYFRVHNLEPNQVFEIDTPNTTVNVLRDGVYRFRVDANSGMTFVVVRQGAAEITGGGQAVTVNPGNSAQVSGSGQLSFDVEPAPSPDEFDEWCSRRDYHEAHLTSARYLPPTLIGSEDLDDNGTWETTGQYGPVWYPTAVAVGWAPYRFGHWVWIDPWGWTWVDEARWGFAPFHYGRWVYFHERWGWCPGPVVVAGHSGPPVRPHYAPALVAWFGGAHLGVSISAGGPSLGWVALGFGELYTPPYHCSPHYFNNVNVSNTRVVNNVNITNVYNTVYVNKTVYNQSFVNVHSPNGVVAMRHAAFASGQPVRQSGVVMSSADVQRFQPANEVVMAPPVAPQRHPLAALPGSVPVARPPERIEPNTHFARDIPRPVAPVAPPRRPEEMHPHPAPQAAALPTAPKEYPRIAERSQNKPAEFHEAPRHEEHKHEDKHKEHEHAEHKSDK